MEYGLEINFGTTFGHRRGDSWTFRAAPAHIVVNRFVGGGDLVNARLTRDALQEKIEEQRTLGLLSIFTNSEASDDELVLIHSMDQILTGVVSITAVA